MASFTPEEVAGLQGTDNDKVNAFYLARWNSPQPPLQPDANDASRKALIKQKYVDRAWFSDLGGGPPAVPAEVAVQRRRADPGDLDDDDDDEMPSSPVRGRGQARPEPPEFGDDDGEDDDMPLPEPKAAVVRPQMAAKRGRRGRAGPAQEAPVQQQTYSPPRADFGGQQQAFGQQQQAFTQQQPGFSQAPQPGEQAGALFGDDLLDVESHREERQAQIEQRNELKDLIDTMMEPDMPGRNQVNPAALRAAGFGEPTPQPMGYAAAPMGFQQPMGYQQQPMGFQQQPMGFQQQPMGYQQQPMGFQQQPMGYQQQPMGFQQQPMGFQQPQPTGYQQQPMGYQTQRKKPDPAASLDPFA